MIGRAALLIPLLTGVSLPFCPGQVLPEVKVDPSATRLAQATVVQAKKKEQCAKAANAEVGWQEEYDIGGAVAAAFAAKQGGGLLWNRERKELEELNRYLAVVGQNLTGRSGRPTILWTFGVLKSETPNAFSAPGGYVFVTSGLLKVLENEAQLAGVLAHEVAHVTQKHALKTYKNVKTSYCLTAMFAGVGGAVAEEMDVSTEADMVNAILRALDLRQMTIDQLKKFVDQVMDTLVTTGNAREDELEADRLAMELMVSAGYSPEEYLKLLRRMPQGGGIFAHHPKNVERVQALVAHRAQMKPAEGDSFSPWADHPFDHYPTVPFGEELKAVK